MNVGFFLIGNVLIRKEVWLFFVLPGRKFFLIDSEEMLVIFVFRDGASLNREGTW